MIYYVSPTGLASNRGAIDSPWDLQTALDNPVNITGGLLFKDYDELHLLDGVYKGCYEIKTTSRLLIKPENYGKVTLDANQDIKLKTDVTNLNSKIYIELDSGIFPSPAELVLDDELIQVIRDKTNYNKYLVNARGWSGTTKALHTAGIPVTVFSNNILGNGKKWTLTELEITNSKVERIIPIPGSNPIHKNSRKTAIHNFAPDSKIINNVIHNTGQGVFGAISAIDSEVYGNLIYNNGEESPDRGHGHGVYTQNDTGRKTYDENIMFGNFGGFGLKAYGSSEAIIKGFDLTGNIVFRNRLLIGGNCPADDITLTENWSDEGYAIGYGNPNNGTITLQGNYGSGGIPFDIKGWKKVIMRDNYSKHIYSSTGAVVAIQFTNADDIKNYIFERNKYSYARSKPSNPITFTGAIKETISFVEWQNRGYDAGSTYVNTFNNPQPKVQEIEYRKNKYKEGRCHIKVMNFENVITLEMNKTGLKDNQQFEVRNGANFLSAPLYKGIYNKDLKVSINSSDLKIAQPSGNSTYKNKELLDFAVFVVVPLGEPVTTQPSSIKEVEIKLPVVDSENNHLVEFTTNNVIPQLFYTVDNLTFRKIETGTDGLVQGQTYKFVVNKK